MNNSNLQSLLSLNAKVITALEATVNGLLANARLMAEAGEKAFSIEDYKEANFYRKQLAKRVVSQKAIKADIAENNKQARLDAKAIKLFGKQALSDRLAPEVLSVEIEAALDEALAIKFPKKADTRPADHPSFKRAA